MNPTTFIGYRHVKYTSKSGGDVEGYSLYFTEERNGVEGLCCFDAWVSLDTFLNYFSSLPLGSVVELTYNRYGRVCGCSV